MVELLTDALRKELLVIARRDVQNQTNANFLKLRAARRDLVLERPVAERLTTNRDVVSHTRNCPIVVRPLLLVTGVIRSFVELKTITF